MKYIERFELKDGKTNFALAISHEPITSIFSDGKSAGFHPWSGGCGISGTHHTIGGARLVCFQHVKADINRKISEYDTRLVELKRLSETLGDDVFNLGQFKVKA
jgi:hypothetical protein